MIFETAFKNWNSSDVMLRTTYNSNSKSAVTEIVLTILFYPKRSNAYFEKPRYLETILNQGSCLVVEIWRLDISNQKNLQPPSQF